MFDGEVVDPQNLDTLAETLKASDPESRLAPLGMRRIDIGEAALYELPQAVSELLPKDNKLHRVVLVADTTPIQREGRDLKAEAERLLTTCFEVRREELGAHGGELHADEETLIEAERVVAEADLVVSVGSGTITDVCKVASQRAGGKPLVVVQTAASVDGYADDVSVVLKSGVKRTIPSRWPDALLVDLPTLTQAPYTMTTAGFGDAISMYTAPADCYLSTLLGMDNSYHPAPIEMLMGHGREVIEGAAGLSRREPVAIERLARLLVVRGIASGVSGSTAILSGAEHLVSHMIDMKASYSGLKVGAHGAQVGVATIPVAAAWELLLDELDPSEVDVDACFPEPEVMKDKVSEVFSRIDSDGSVEQECWNDYSKKLELWRSSQDRFQAFLDEWPMRREEIRDMVATPERLGRALRSAGAPICFGDLPSPVARHTTRWAFENCHLMRSRFTIVDLLFFLGWWNEELVERLLRRAETIAEDRG